MDIHQVIYPVCSVFVTAPTVYILARLMVIEDFLFQDLNYGTTYQHL